MISQKKQRLIVVQGSIQLLVVLSVLQTQKERQIYDDCDDTLLIGGLGNKAKMNSNQMQDCLHIAQVWDFKRIVLFSNFEELFTKRHCRFSTPLQVFRDHMMMTHVDVVYVCRNWQFVNELVLWAYPKAYSICYGDGLGRLDLDSVFWVKKTSNPRGFKAIDEIFTVAPAGSSQGLQHCKPKFRMVDPECFRSVVKHSAQSIPGLEQYCKTILKEIKAPLALVLTSYLTESRCAKSLKDEINSYLDCILSSTQEGDTVLIKSHPRETLNQAELLSNELQRQNRNAIIISQFPNLPIELFALYLPISTAIPLVSSSCISLMYLSNCNVVVGLGEKITRMYYNKDRQDYMLVGESINILQTEQAKTGLFSVLEYLSDDVYLKAIPKGPTVVKPSTVNNQPKWPLSDQVLVSEPPSLRTNFQHRVENILSDADVKRLSLLYLLNPYHWVRVIYLGLKTIKLSNPLDQVVLQVKHRLSTASSYFFNLG